MGKADGHGVYMILNAATNARYVGLTKTSFSSRWTNHRFSLRRGKHECPALQRDWNTFGPTAFSFIVLEALDEEADGTAERRWVERFHDQGVPLYNKIFNDGYERPAGLQAAAAVARGEQLSKDWVLRAPSGEILHIHNMEAFARERELRSSSLRDVAKGNRRVHKGYTNVNELATLPTRRWHQRDETWSLREPDGTVMEVTNLSAYAREHALDISALRKAILGLRPSYKGYTCPANPAPVPPAPKPKRLFVCPQCGKPKYRYAALCRTCFLASDRFHEHLRANAAAANRAANVARWGAAHLALRDNSATHESP